MFSLSRLELEQLRQEADLAAANVRPVVLSAEMLHRILNQIEDLEVEAAELRYEWEEAGVCPMCGGADAD